MKELLTRFTKNLAILSTLVALVGVSLHFMAPGLATPALPWLILLFIATTFSLYYILLRAVEKKFNQFTNYFMVASVSKLLLLLTIITVYVYFYRDDAIRFVISVCLLYLVYTVFEVNWLLKINKTK
jgi:hypothetical protein